MTFTTKTCRILLIVRCGVISTLACLLGCSVSLMAATSTPPDRMTYQGYLVDNGGLPLGNSSPKNYDVLFGIYAAETGGTSLWEEKQTVTVDKGYFSVLLGEGAATPGKQSLPQVFAIGSGVSDRFVELAVTLSPGQSPLIIKPRLRLLTSPYAFLAQNALTATTATTAGSATTASALAGNNGSPLVATSGSNVGIGVTNPTAPLQVVGSGNSQGILKVSSTSAGSSASISLDATALTGGKNYLVYSTGNTATEGGGKLVVRNATDANTIMTLTGSGAVGIGTNAPASPLHISTTGVTDLRLSSTAAKGNDWVLRSSVDGSFALRNVSGNNNVMTSTGNGIQINGTLNVGGEVNLGSTSQYAATASTESLRIVRGKAPALTTQGSSSSGIGWSATRTNSTGVYVVTFNPPFQDAPIVTANSGSAVVLVNVTATNRVEMYLYSVTQNTAKDGDFSFIAIGKR